MKNRTYGWALIVLVLVFGIAAIVAYRRNHERALSIPTAANLASYENDTYGYTFYYPADYTVRVASEEDIIIGMATSSSFVTYAEARIATTSQSGSYEDFVLAAARNLCAALPGYSCSDPVERGTYTTETNLSGERFYLDMKAPDGSQQRFGPVYAFNVGGNVTNASYATLFVYRPLGATGAVEKLPAEDIAGKLSIHKVERK